MQSLKNSPQIEGFRAKGIEVLFLTDTIDDFWLQNVSDYKGKSFKSVTKGDINLGKNKDEKKDEKSTETHKDLLENLKKLLEDDVSEVRISNRLTDSPVCLVAPEGGVDMHMERVLKIDPNFQAARFFCDIEGHPDKNSFKLALEELGFYATDVKFLGAYPAHPFRANNNKGTSIN